MTHVAYLVAGYGLTTAILGGYAGWILRRERALSRDLGGPRATPVAPAE